MTQPIPIDLRVEMLNAQLLNDITDRLTADGFVCLACPANSTVPTALISALGAFLDVYDDGIRWSELTVRLDAAPNRTHGTGINALHLDYVNRSEPPAFIGLLGCQLDPLGGGATMLASLWDAVAKLPEAARVILSKPWFGYWNDAGAKDVGEPLQSFAVIDGPWVRFTAKMLPHLRDGVPESMVVLTDEGRANITAVRESMEMLNALLMADVMVRRLAPGELLLFDQRRYAHGRCALGGEQSKLPFCERRLLKQTYFSMA